MSQVNLKIHCKTIAYRDMCEVHKQKKKDVTHSLLCQRALELMFNHCTLGGSQRAICPGMLHTVCATRRSYFVHLGEGTWQGTGRHRALRRKALGFRGVVAAVGEVVLLLVISCCRCELGWVLPSSVSCLPYCLSFFSNSQTFFRSNTPCINVLHIITLSGFLFFIFHKFIQVVSPSFGWSSCLSLRSRRCDNSQIPLSGFSGPSVWVLGGDPEGLSPLQILLCFDPICDVVSQHLFISFVRASLYVFNPVF